MLHTLNYKTPPKYSAYKKRHMLRFNNKKMLSESEFNKMSNKNCTYCGIEGPNGIDRFDNNKGYQKINCVPCCKHCNYVKGNLSIDDFKEWKNRFVKHQIKIKKGSR